jgi:RNA polymerase sigma factor (sigma-70 family)
MANDNEQFWQLNIQDLCNHRLLSHQEEIAIFEAMEESSDPDEIKQLRDKMITHNGRLVASVALRYKNHYDLRPRELAQEGVIGLIRAIDKFDYKRGYKFSTYAIYWIRQAVERAIAIQGRTIRLPVYKHDMYYRLLELTGNCPGLSQGEMAEMLGTSPDAISQLVQLGPGTLSLDASPFVSDDPDVDDAYAIVADDSAKVDYDDRRKILEQKLSTLKPREEKILRLRFGFQDGQFRTLDQVAKKYGLTRERIRQLEKAALEKLAKDESLRELL